MASTSEHSDVLEMKAERFPAAVKEISVQFEYRNVRGRFNLWGFMRLQGKYRHRLTDPSPHGSIQPRVSGSAPV